MDCYILIIIFLIFSYLIYQINNIKKNEEFINTSSNSPGSSISPFGSLVATQVNSIYEADIQSIKNISLVAQGLTQSNGYNVKGGLTISGILNLNNAQINNNLTVSGTINGINIIDMNNAIQILTNSATQILNNLNIQASQTV